MTALTVIGCILLFLVFLLSIKVTVTVIYNEELMLYVRVLFVKIKILPKSNKKSGPHSMSTEKAKKIRRKLKKKSEKKKLKAKEKKRKKQEKKENVKAVENKKSFSEIIEIIRMITDVVKTALKVFFGHIRIKVARLHVNVATGDAATTAIAYGAISQAAFYLFDALELPKNISKPDVRDFSVKADYLSDKLTADIKISFSVRLWHVLHTAFAALGKAIKHLLKIKAKQENKK